MVLVCFEGKMGFDCCCCGVVLLIERGEFAVLEGNFDGGHDHVWDSRAILV